MGTKVQCPSCKNVESKSIFHNMPPGGKVCPECNSQYGPHWAEA